jgi:hypothetical protein
MGQRSIVLWPEWPRRPEVMSDTLVALICILWLFSQPLEKPLSIMEARRQINER